MYCILQRNAKSGVVIGKLCTQWWHISLVWTLAWTNILSYKNYTLITLRETWLGITFALKAIPLVKWSTLSWYSIGHAVGVFMLLSHLNNIRLHDSSCWQKSAIKKWMQGKQQAACTLATEDDREWDTKTFTIQKFPAIRSCWMLVTQLL